jgi:hypothetical protein
MVFVGASTLLVSIEIARSVRGPAPMGSSSPSERTPMAAIGDAESRPIPVSFPWRGLIGNRLVHTAARENR